MLELVKDVVDEDVILVCDHPPRTNWTQFERGEVLAVSDDGMEVVPDYIAVCDDCFALPFYEVKAHVLHRARK